MLAYCGENVLGELRLQRQVATHRRALDRAAHEDFDLGVQQEHRQRVPSSGELRGDLRAQRVPPTRPGWDQEHKNDLEN